MYNNKINCVGVLVICFFYGISSKPLNFTTTCIQNTTKNLGVSKDTPLIITFNGSEFEKEIDQLAKSDLNSSSESITAKIITNTPLESSLHIEELKILPQSYTLKSLKKPIQDFITNSFFLKNRLHVKFGSAKIKIEPGASGFNIDGLEEYLIKNPSINEVEVYRLIFQNHQNEKIGLCIHQLLYSAFKFHDDEVTYSLNIDDHPYNIVFLSKEQYLSSDFLIEKEFSRIIEKESSRLSHLQCLKNQTMEDEDDENNTSHHADYDYYGELFLF